MEVTLRIDTASVERAVGDIKDGLPRVLTRVLNRSLGEVHTLVKRGVAADTGLPVGEVDKSLEEFKATHSNLVARLVVTGRRIPLITFKARGPEPSRGRGRGVTYSIGRNARTRVESGFIATMKSGHRGVFARLSGQGPATGLRVGRLPIVELKGPSLPRVLTNQWIAQGWDTRGQEIVEKNLDHEVAYLLERAGKGGVTA